MTYDNVFTLMDVMLEHCARTGEQLRCSDDPMRREIGFATDTEAWMVGLMALKKVSTSPDHRAPLLRELLPSIEGRQRLVDSINQGHPLI
jgi:hypothetical protein